ncbi:glycoside hydrolase family 3 protein [Streptomyces sp. HSG2]|uniref:glycoside hydrolase family 3 protein n=1 Tax=Streptomyces sp. HSG2 TaxID=2797167 RepID=UPI001905C6C4|nr:glycoside hydrolase family 3 protein [Streptomyces sp. HSG2]
MQVSRAGSTGPGTGPSRRAVLAATGGATAALAAGAAPAHATGGRPGDDGLASLVSRMTLEEKVGQLFVTRVYGHSATDPDQADVDANLRELGVRTAAELIARYRVGGVIYFSWAGNTRDPRRIADLSDGIQRASLGQDGGVPVLVSTDQEHGAVARVGRPATLLPGAMALGAGGSTQDARTAGRIAGAELRALGIHQDYAPVADVNVDPANPVIGVRSFGADPRAVAGLVAAQVTGYQRAGVAACAKHFPGHGDTATDSHTGLPVITHSRERWEELDAPPFRAAIEAGVESIMTAHLLVPALDDSGDPATLSRPILTGLLREELGYDGLVITDSLGMAGVRTKYGDDRVPVLALLAGADQLLNPPDLALAHASVLGAVREGELTEARIDVSVLRVLRAKARLGLFRDAYTEPRDVERVVGARAHLVAAERIAARTTTLLVNEGEALPLSRRRTPRVLVVGADPVSPTGTTGPPTAVLAQALSELGFSATARSTGVAPTPAAADEAVTAAEDVDAVVVATYDVEEGDGQGRLVGRLVATGLPVVAVAIGTPYDVGRLPRVSASLATYSWTDVELRAAARVIAGRERPRGRLPVPVTRGDDPATTLHPIGHGLSYRG